MSEFKYLSDGRKVLVVGKLNNVEYIVQEIFVTTGGDEVPSGERFTTKNLHDEPVVSYREKREKESEQRLKRIERDIETAESKCRAIEVQQAALKSMYSSALRAPVTQNSASPNASKIVTSRSTRPTAGWKTKVISPAATGTSR